MIEYRIEIPAYRKTVHGIWKKFLKNDSTWHYTLEGDYIELRVAKRMPEIEEYFKKQDWEFTSFEYKDNIPITRKYQKHFEKIFHGYSELSMLTMHWKRRSDVPKVMERCIHLTHNAFQFGLLDEAMNLAKGAVYRAHLAGKLGFDFEDCNCKKCKEKRKETK